MSRYRSVVKHPRCLLRRGGGVTLPARGAGEAGTRNVDQAMFLVFVHGFGPKELVRVDAFAVGRV